MIPVWAGKRTLEICHVDVDTMILPAIADAGTEFGGECHES